MWEFDDQCQAAPGVRTFENCPRTLMESCVTEMPPLILWSPLEQFSKVRITCPKCAMLHEPNVLLYARGWRNGMGGPRSEPGKIYSVNGVTFIVSMPCLCMLQKSWSCGVSPWYTEGNTNLFCALQTVAYHRIYLGTYLFTYFIWNEHSQSAGNSIWKNWMMVSSPEVKIHGILSSSRWVVEMVLVTFTIHHSIYRCFFSGKRKMSTWNLCKMLLLMSRLSCDHTFASASKDYNSSSYSRYSA